ncbi:hypothetical protein [Mariprofundus sp. KV]|uniref:hypothetical protein n=1 Tax=Mariprofundus sp. KV TaxID=2608715 RepID=UPI0015A19BD4|nr:hypothetical protein [Mariprofundus sp. KV]NWF36011.1 hypothetical protein [Mariprofundus sp. KV]
MKAVTLLLSSLLLLSATATAQDFKATNPAGESTFLASFMDGATKVTMLSSNRSTYKQRHIKPYVRQQKFDDDAYLRRISYND